MIKFKNITIRNFMSCGNITQAVNFEDSGLTLVLGNNLDLGGDGSRNGVGKAQPLYSKIKTPSGWTTMGELKVNDVIMAGDGTNTTVTGIYPQGRVETYKFTFADGRSTHACKDHLWKVKSHAFKNCEYKIMSTAQIVDHNEKYKNHKSKSGYYLYIPYFEEQDSAEVDLPLDPYFLGAMLGGGSFSKSGLGFTSADSQVVENIQSRLPSYLQMNKEHYSEYGYAFKLKSRTKYSPFTLALKELNLYGTLSDTKFVPDMYKNASKQQKIALLQGIIDTNGYVGGNGSLSICTVSERMALDLQYIVRSIGGAASLSKKATNGYKNKDGVFIECKDSYNISIKYHTPKVLSNLDRKINQLPDENYQYRSAGLRITSVEKIEPQDSQCIMVSHPDHLYVTDDFIVTHNTTMINALSYALYGNAITNIRKNNLINKTNNKGMLVTVEFSVNGAEYRIERGRSPNVLRFLINSMDVVEETDEGQGEMRFTQLEIERVIGMNHVMFKHLIALNTYNEPFLALRANDQRDIIENLLGITLLSEKAVVLKDLLRITKEQIKEEEYRIKGVESANEQIKKSIDDLKRRARVWRQKNTETIASFTSQVSELEKLDIEFELAQHMAFDAYNKSSAELSDYNKALANFESNVLREQRIKGKAEKDLEAAKDHKCYACGQDVHDTANDKIIESKTADVLAAAEAIAEFETAIADLRLAIADIKLPDKMPETKYATAQEAYEQQSQLTTLQNKLADLIAAEDPYKEQVTSLEEVGLRPIEWDTMNNLHNLREHQEFLMKLLTNKDSFIRKRIIEQNLQYLNSRLNYYLNKLGLPHEVVFQSDLNVEITELGRELDFDNLSRGERNRLILGLSWAFRDVHESTNTPIDFMAIDELIDNGLDSNGVESALLVLKKMHRDRNKNIFLISHREELIGRVNNTLYVVKENGFTSFSTDQEFDIDTK